MNLLFIIAADSRFILFVPKTLKQPPKLKIEKKILTFNLPASTHELLHKAAAATGISRSAYVDRAVREQMKRDGIE
jgi:predicted HicB family RNase H-like nuclease